jgi:hypothetical protein
MMVRRVLTSVLLKQELAFRMLMHPAVSDHWKKLDGFSGGLKIFAARRSAQHSARLH